MSTPLDTTPLQKALNALRKIHKEIAESKESLIKMKSDFAKGMEDTNPSDVNSVRSLGELGIRIELMPKFLRKTMELRPALSVALRSEIDSLWKQLETTLQNDQISFINDHEKKITAIFGDRSREMLCYATAFPKPNWNTEDRGQITRLIPDTNFNADIADDYDRDATHDRQICWCADNLLKIAAAYKPYKKA
jgi:hypothetical protein